MPDIIQQLKKSKNDPSFGAVSDVQKERARVSLLQAIGHTREREESLMERSSRYIEWNISKFVSMPLTVAVTAFILVIGGSFTTVSAASNSLPGDALYSVKIAAERAQIRLASLERKAILHTEFAERRLKEAAAIRDSGDLDREARVAGVLDEFRRQMQQANNDLRRLRSENNSEVVEVATRVDRKIEELNSVIGTQDDPNESEDKASALETTKESSKTVVDVIVESHEADPGEHTSFSVERTYKDRLEDVQTRQTFNLGRIVVIRQWADENQQDVNELVQLEFSIKNASDAVYESMNLAASGSYRMAFDMLTEVKAQLIDIESALAEIETMIVQKDNEQNQQPGEAGQIDESTEAEISDESINTGESG